MADLPLLSVSQYHGVIPRAKLTNREGRADDLSNYKVCAAGDIVINRMSAYQGALGLSRTDGLVSPDYLVVRPASNVSPDFLSYLFRSAWFVGEMTSRIRGIGSVDQGNVRTPRINEQDLGRIVLNLPSLALQRSIADFLNRETARIDSLVAAKVRMVELLAARFRAAVTHSIVSQEGSPIALKYVADCLPGYAFRSDEMTSAAPDGYRLLRGINIGVGRIHWDEVAYCRQVGADMRRYWLRSGDIVVGMDRPVISGGMRVALVSDRDTPSLLVQRVARIRARDGRISNNYIRFVLSSEAFTNSFTSDLTGVSVPHVSEQQIMAFRFPLPSSMAEQRLIDELSDLERRVGRATDHLNEQMALLQERRQALITAAVTGERGIPEAA